MEEQPNTQPEVKKYATGLTPGKDIDLKDLGLTVAGTWKQNPQITLVWTTQPVFEGQIVQFQTTLSERYTTGGGRSPITSELKELDKKADDGLVYVKDMFKEKYGKSNLSAYYPQLGLIKIRNAYKFPVDRNLRRESFKQLLLALTAHGFDAEKYGTAYWQPIYTRYDELMKAATDTDSLIAEKVKVKNQLREEILLTLNSLIHIVKGNYPKDYKSVLREWGFQKEKY